MRSTLCLVATAAEPLGALLERYDAGPAIADGRAFVDGLRANDPNQQVAPGASVEVYPARDRVETVVILAEHAGLLFVDKPAGLATEPDRRGASEALSTRVAEALGLPREGVNALSRLDVGVSGVVVFGTDPEGRRRLAKLREQGLVRRRYVAIAAKAPELCAGIWNDPIARREGGPRRAALPEGQHAQTRYRVVGSSTESGAVVLALEPLTGRTHQLRVHASTHGAPFFGDRAYGGPNRIVQKNGRVIGLGRILLHAAWVELPSQARVVSPLPPELIEIWAALDGDALALARAVDEPVSN